MKKTLTIIAILISSALIALFWVRIDDFLSKKAHPLEYMEVVEKYSDEYSVPKELIFAVIKAESDFKSDAVSGKGAIGLMQLMPETYAWLCEKSGDVNTDSNFLYTPEVNIRYGTYYLDMLYSEFGSWENALAAYNAGPANVRKWLKDPSLSENGALSDIPFGETRNYIERVFKARDKYKELYFIEE